MKISRLLFMLIVLTIFGSCKPKIADSIKKPLLEVEGKFLYVEDVNEIIPPGLSTDDSIEIAQSFIRKWITDVLVYENAKRNITNEAEIDALLEDYKKSLTIHQYQQKLIEQRLPKTPSVEELKDFYEKYNEQFTLKENLIQGILLIVPNNAPQLNNVRNWVKNGNTKSLENIEKYSIKNAISYDYFLDRWVSFTDILKKLPLQIEDPSDFIRNNSFVDTSDSTRHYFLKIQARKLTGEIEPFEMAKPVISNIMMNKLKSDFIANFEDEIYKDAIKSESVTYFK